MREWIPVPGTTKGRLVAVALAEFGRRGFDAVSVTALAADAGVTVGSLYHHFGSKVGLYDAVRDDVHKRLADRMEGAWAATSQLAPALLVAFDYTVEAGFAGLLSETHPEGGADPVEAFLREYGCPDALSTVLAAAWRSALGVARTDPAAARAALVAVVAVTA